MTTRKLIRAAFESRILTFAKSKTPLIPVSIENIKFDTPAVDVLYLRTSLIPSPEFNTSICFNTENKSGLFQIDIMSPVNIGVKKAEDLAEEIVALFPQGFKLGGVYVSAPVEQERAQTDKDRYILSLSIYYSMF